MKYLALILLPLIIITACKKKNLGTWQTERIYFKNCVYRYNYGIDTFTRDNKINYGPSSDTSRIFFSYTSGRDDKYASESMFAVYLDFQADKRANSFVYKDKQIKEHLTYYYAGGPFILTPQTLIDKGTISGTRQTDSTWQIYIDVQLPQYDQNANLSGITDTITAVDHY